MESLSFQETAREIPSIDCEEEYDRRAPARKGEYNLGLVHILPASIGGALEPEDRIVNTAC